MYISYVHSWQEISTSCQWLLKFFCKLFWEQDLVSFEMYLAQQILLLRLCVFRCQILPGWQPSLWNGGLRLYEGWFWISQNICLRFSVTSYGKTWTFWPIQYTHESWQKRRHFCQIHVLDLHAAFPGGSVVKNPPTNAGHAGDMGLTHGLGRSPGEENSNPFQCSWLEISMDRGAWRATIHGVSKNWTWLSDWGPHTTDLTCLWSVVSDSLWPHGLQPIGLLCPSDSPGKNTGAGCHFLLHWIFPNRDWRCVSCIDRQFL